MSVINIERKPGHQSFELLEQDTDVRDHLPGMLKLCVFGFYLLLLFFVISGAFKYLGGLGLSGDLRNVEAKVAGIRQENASLRAQVTAFDESKKRAETIKKWLATNVHAQRLLATVVQGVSSNVSMSSLQFRLLSDRQVSVEFNIHGNSRLNLSTDAEKIVNSFKALGYTVLNLGQKEIGVGGKGIRFTGTFILPTE